MITEDRRQRTDDRCNSAKTFGLKMQNQFYDTTIAKKVINFLKILITISVPAILLSLI